jgi:hypothetical protein
MRSCVWLRFFRRPVSVLNVAEVSIKNYYSPGRTHLNNFCFHPCLQLKDDAGYWMLDTGCWMHK